MHELSIAVSLIEEVEKIMQEEKAERLLRLVVSVGDLSGVEVEALEVCFPMAAEGTKLEKAELVLERIPIEVKCRSCGATGDVEQPLYCCRSCKSRDVEITKGRELNIRSLEVE